MKRALIFLVVLILLAFACDSGDPSAIAPTGTPQPPSLPPGAQPAAVLSIIDGDTIDVDINGVEYRVRYIGIDTPERGMPYYNEATEANRRLVDGQTVYLVKDVSETDRYGRLLRYIYLADGAFVNEELVQSGHAQAATFPPDVAFADHFRQLQEEARLAGRGLWAE